MSLQLWQSIPFAMILLPLGSAALTSVLPKHAARLWCAGVLALETLLSAFFFSKMLSFGQMYTYSMGHYPAPWGNELRAGPLEALVSLCFAVILLLSVLGGFRKLEMHVDGSKQNLYCALLMLLTCAMQAQLYTNDAFTAYVFVEILTLAAAGLITARSDGKGLLAGARYMVMNLVGSALFLLAVILLYDLTGHLLMSPMKKAVLALHETERYHAPMTMVIVLLVTGLSVKSALFPFHTWVPDAYGASTPITSAVLSSLLSKSYIFLLMKMMYRAIGMEVIAAARVDDILLLYGILGMIVGSVQAIAQKDLRRMIAWSSVAQIGYIYMGMGLGNEAGMAAALVQLLSHSAAKSMLFLAADGVADARGSSLLQRLRGAGYSTPVFGVIFTVGALSLVGAPLLGGFAAKACFALAAAERDGWRMLLVFAALAVSTLLNAVYFIGAVIQLYRKPDVAEGAKARTGALSAVSVCALALVNLCLGVFASPLVQAIQSGLTLFG